MMIDETDLLQSLVSGQCAPTDPVLRAAKPLQGQVQLDDPLTKVQRVFNENNVAVVVKGPDIIAIISKIDVLEFLAARS